MHFHTATQLNAIVWFIRILHYFAVVSVLNSSGVYWCICVSCYFVFVHDFSCFHVALFTWCTNCVHYLLNFIRYKMLWQYTHNSFSELVTVAELLHCTACTVLCSCYSLVGSCFQLFELCAFVFCVVDAIHWTQCELSCSVTQSQTLLVLLTTNCTSYQLGLPQRSGSARVVMYTWTALEMTHPCVTFAIFLWNCSQKLKKQTVLPLSSKNW